MKHPFIRSAGETSELSALVQRYFLFQQQGKKTPTAAPDFGTVAGGGTLRTEWDFDETIRGTIKGAPVSFDLSALREQDENEGLASGTSTAASTLKARPTEVTEASTGTVRPSQVTETPRQTRDSLVERVIRPAIDTVGSYPSVATDKQVACSGAAPDALHQLQQGFYKLDKDHPDLVRQFLEQLTMRGGR